MNDWSNIAQTLKDKMADKQPEIRVRDVMRWFSLSSTSGAIYYLEHLEKIGAVKHIGERWFVA